VEVGEVAVAMEVGAVEAAMVEVAMEEAATVVVMVEAATVEADRVHMAVLMEVAIGGHIVARMAGIMAGLSIILRNATILRLVS